MVNMISNLLELMEKEAHKGLRDGANVLVEYK